MAYFVRNSSLGNGNDNSYYNIAKTKVASYSHSSTANAYQSFDVAFRIAEMLNKKNNTQDWVVVEG